MARLIRLKDTLFFRDKVRYTYDLGSLLLIVAVDQISAFDRVFPCGHVPCGGYGSIRTHHQHKHRSHADIFDTSDITVVEDFRKVVPNLIA